jgi:MFS family permease
VVAVLGVGRVVGDLPAAALVVRIGEQRAMILAAAVTMVALVVCLVAPAVWLLAVGVGIIGINTAVFGLARHAYLTEVVPYGMRARAMSTLGGVHRIGVFAGPFLGALAIKFAGTAGAYWVHLLAASVMIGLLLILPDVTRGIRGAGQAPDRLVRVVRRHLPVLRTLGTGVLIMGAVRASRQVVIPLWGDYLGLDPAVTSVIFGLSGAVDMLLFYPAGWAMDRFGRNWVVVSSMLVLGLSHVLLPLAASAAGLVAVAMLMGFGNGIGSGIIMTIGADVSPAASRAVFLGAWRLCGDAGNGVGPLLLSAVTVLASLGAAAVVMGVFAGIGAAVMARWIPRYSRQQ